MGLGLGLRRRVEPPIKRNIKRHVARAANFVERRFLRGPSTLRVAVLFLYADRKKYPHSFEQIQRVVDFLSPAATQVISIDNFRQPSPPRQLPSGWIDIAGDNQFWEFSGWQAGLDYLRTTDFNADVVLFLNDAFLNQSSRGKDLLFFQTTLHPRVLETCRDGFYGHYNLQPGPQYLLGKDVSSWIQSNAFVLPMSIASTLRLASLTSEEIDEILPREFNGKFFTESDGICPELKNRLEQWMRSGWQFRAELKPENWKFLRGKMIAILNERMLTAQVREKGVPLYAFGQPEALRGYTPAIPSTEIKLMVFPKK